VYRPVLQFTDKVVSLLPKKYSQLGNDGLQSFIENFVKDQFLPIVYVDYRTRVADALASKILGNPRGRAVFPVNGEFLHLLLMIHSI
jgi:exocyst complex component 4